MVISMLSSLTNAVISLCIELWERYFFTIRAQDHVDRNRSNNNASNLRFVNPHLNAINRRPTGIRYKRFLDGWRVLLFCKNRMTRVGVFKYYNQAYKAACEAKLKLFDEQYKKYLKKYKNAGLQKENEEAKKGVHKN